MISAQSEDFEEYVARNRSTLMRYATVLSGQTWLADDLVSDVLGRAYERWDRIGALADPHAYVRRMITNDYLSWRRRFARTTPRGDGEPSGSVSDGSSEYVERDAMISRLAALPHKQRAAVVLRYYGGMSNVDIAAELGCSEVTVRTQIFRALAKLRISLAADLPTSALESR